MSMTKEDFEKFVPFFSNLFLNVDNDAPTLVNVTNDFCAVAKTINPRFDEAIFKEEIESAFMRGYIYGTNVNDSNLVERG
jgi:hypothetical protein